jgi:hypothetical protein
MSELVIRKIPRVEKMKKDRKSKKPSTHQKEIIDYLMSGQVLCSYANNGCFPELQTIHKKKVLSQATIDALVDKKLMEITIQERGGSKMKFYHLPGRAPVNHFRDSKGQLG